MINYKSDYYKAMGAIRRLARYSKYMKFADAFTNYYNETLKIAAVSLRAAHITYTTRDE